MIVHVVPEKTASEHVAFGCWCVPDIEEYPRGKLLIHHHPQGDAVRGWLTMPLVDDYRGVLAV